MFPRNKAQSAGKRSRRYGWGLTASVAGLVFAGMSGQAAMAAQTKTFVLSWFLQAAYSYDGDCPEGINPLPEEMFRYELKGIGQTQAQIDAILGDLKGGVSGAATTDALVNRGRIDGKPVNAYTYPTAVPDVGLHEVKGRYAFGFNLDGRGASSPKGFEDPETHETGVNNEYWRAMGCNLNHRGTPAQVPTEWSSHWDIQRDKMPAWLMTLTADDFSKDGDVTVVFDKALERITRDANGYVRVDSTFRIDPDPRWHNVLRGKIKDGTITVGSGEVHLSGDPYLLTQLDVLQAHLRLKLNADRTAEGILGGYTPWRRIFFMYGSSGYSMETMIGTDIPGAFYTLKRHADAYPDPKTGENTAISAAYKIVAVPAFAIAVDGGDKKTAQAGQPVQTP